jgi:DNA-binding FadR family transcriptional regulator
MTAPRKPSDRDMQVVASDAVVRGRQWQLVDRIGHAIATGEISARAQIVPEDLAEEHGVSRPVIREAIKVLETKGMVAARPRTGTRVRPLTEWKLLDPDVIRWRSAGPDATRQIEELLAIRGAIEPLAARQASERPENRPPDDLLATLEEMAAAVQEQDWEKFTEADVVFHRRLLLASGSEMMTQFVEPIEAAIRVRHRLRLIPEQLSPDVVGEHRRIVDAIGDGDPVRAERASRSIVDVAGEETMESLTRASGPVAR